MPSTLALSLMWNLQGFHSHGESGYTLVYRTYHFYDFLQLSIQPFSVRIVPDAHAYTFASEWLELCVRGSREEAPNYCSKLRKEANM